MIVSSFGPGFAAKCGAVRLRRCDDEHQGHAICRQCLVGLK
jgi:hypothetical protein